MSKTTKVSFPKCFAMRRNGKTTIIMGRNHFTRDGEKGDEVYIAAMNYRNKQSKKSLEALEDLLHPRRKYLQKGGLVEVGNQVCFEGTEIPIPKSLETTLIEWLESGWSIEPLKNFWYRSMLNPNTTARDDSFEYCNTYGITITDEGYAVLYKTVTHKTLIPRELDLAGLVGENYLKVVRRGDNPEEYFVLQDESAEEPTYFVMGAGDDFPEDSVVVGPLSELFLQIPELSKNKPTTVYTDRHTKTMDIRLGIPVVQDRNLCDPNINAACSKGLHVGSYGYVKAFAKPDDTIFAVLVDPMNIVALPKSDTSKIRTCDYLPYAIMERHEDGRWEELESHYFESDFELHDAKTLTQRYQELEESLMAEALGELDSLQAVRIRSTLAIVQTRLQTLSHVDVTQEEEVSRAEAEEGFLFDPNDNTGTNIYQEPDLFEEDEDWFDDDDYDGDEGPSLRSKTKSMYETWSLKNASGETILTFPEWVDRQ